MGFNLPMPNGALFKSWFAAVSLIAGLASASAQIYYDGAVGLPAGQGWTYFATGGTQTLTNNGVLFDTSTANNFQGGYSHTTVRLNRTNGFALLFTSQLLAEAHVSASRAGFSIIMLGDDKRGIELGFWTNNIFAQSDSPLFTRAEETNFTTTVAVDYTLTFHPTNYVLSANGIAILSGPVRDYTAFSGFPNPYSSANFLFLGDDTTSAAGAVLLKKVVLVTAPQLVALSDKLISWAGVSNQTYTVQGSSNLVNWSVAGIASSATSNFVFTNNTGASPQFFRVTHP